MNGRTTEGKTMDRKPYHSPNNIHDALELLNEAAKERRHELYDALEDQYEDFRYAVHEVAHTVKDKVTGTVKDKAKKATKAAAAAAATAALKAGEEKIEEKVRRQAQDFDRKVRRNPWLYLTAVTIGGLILGYGLSCKSNDRNHKGKYK
jgi:ElaB/YqjD/DUF883 family membrane-anchored ribosome-binding protein